MISIGAHYFLVRYLAVKAAIKVTLSMIRFAAKQSAAVSVVRVFNEFRLYDIGTTGTSCIKFINDGTRNAKVDQNI